MRSRTASCSCGELRIEGVSFRYGSADRLVLQDVRLRVAPGEFVAITGPSGAAARPRS